MPLLLLSSPRPPSIRVGRRSSCSRGDRSAFWMPVIHFPARSPPGNRGSGWGFSSCPSRALASSSAAKAYANREGNEVQDEKEEKRSSRPQGLQTGSLPQHVAVIMDGNSRWARKRGLPLAAGLEAGVRAVQEVVRLSCSWGIPILTVFAFSMDNWNRPQAEVDILMRLFQSVLRNEVATFKRWNLEYLVYWKGDTVFRRQAVGSLDCSNQIAVLKQVLEGSFEERWFV